MNAVKENRSKYKSLDFKEQQKKLGEDVSFNHQPITRKLYSSISRPPLTFVALNFTG